MSKLLRYRLQKIKNAMYQTHFVKKHFSMSDLALALQGFDENTKREYRLQLINEAIFEKGRNEPILFFAQNGFSNPANGEPPEEIKKQIRHALYKAKFDKNLVSTWFK
jgi:hypothetical protein